jgi:CSLREA domain-containing protein
MAAIAATVCVLAPAAHAATITVTTTADAVANDGACSLREALNAAATDAPSSAAAGECRAGSGADTIVLGAAHYTLTRAGTPDDTNVNGDLDVISGTLTIAGAGQSATTIDAGGIDRALDVLKGATLTVENATITGGKLPAGISAAPTGPGTPGGPASDGGDSKGAAGGAGESGGGVRNAGTLTLQDVTVSGNRAGDGGAGGPGSNGGDGGDGTTGGGGGGGFSFGGNGGAGGDGGGVFNNAGTVTISASMFVGNASGAGGPGGTGANGGTGGAGAGNGGGGGGGGCFGGSGGSGGNGGAIGGQGGTLTIGNSDIEQNAAGGGGGGSACGSGGTGGKGAGSGKGGIGGYGFPGSGAEGGGGGGVSDFGGALTLSDTTIASNLAGNGGAASSDAVGGDGGNDGTGPGQGKGNFVDAGSGGTGGFGGGVYVISTGAGSATATLTGDTLAGNLSGSGANGGNATHGGNGSTSDGGSGGEGGFGGGAYFDAPASATNLTVTANTTGTGGAGGAGGTGPAESSGGGGGEGGFGGGINLEFGSLAHITDVGNTTGAGGAGGNAGIGTPALAGSPGAAGLGGDLIVLFNKPTVTLSASIVGTCDDPPVDGGGNIASPGPKPCPGLVAAPGIGPLADNGGPTKTMALLPGSTAVDHVAAPCGTTPDQRGVARPQGAGCDAGAYELAPPGVTTGAASQVTTSDATVAGQILTNARATSWHVDFGPTTAYGSQMPAQALPGGLAAIPVMTALSGLPAHTVIHYRLVATNGDGTTVGPDATFTTLTPTPKFVGVGIVKRTLTVSSTGRVKVTLTCPPSASGACTGTLAMTIKVKSKAHGKKSKAKKPKTTTVTLARSTFRIAAGSSKSVQLHLNSKALSLLRAAGHGGLTVTLAATASDAGGARANTSISEKLKAPRRR